MMGKRKNIWIVSGLVVALWFGGYYGAAGEAEQTEQQGWWAARKAAVAERREASAQQRAERAEARQAEKEQQETAKAAQKAKEEAEKKVAESDQASQEGWWAARKAAVAERREASAQQRAERAEARQAEKEQQETVKAEQKAKEEAEKKAVAEQRASAGETRRARAEARARQRDEERRAGKAAKIEELEKSKAELQSKLDVPPSSPRAPSDLSKVSVGMLGQPVETEGWKVGAGVTRRYIGKTSFETKGYSHSYPVPDRSGYARRDGNVGVQNEVGERNYSDGYVGKDVWTDLDGGTWNWGYNNAAQVNDGMVTMQGILRSVRRFERSVTTQSGDWDKSSDRETGVFVEAEKILNRRPHLDYGLVVNASRSSFSAWGGGETFRDRQDWNTRDVYIRDRYDISGTGITPQSQPYRGDETGPGPQINNVPAQRTTFSRLRSSGSYEVFNRTDGSLEMDLSTLSLGLLVRKNIRWVGVSCSAGATFNVVEKEAKYEETLFESLNGSPFSPLAYWSEKDNNTEYVFGAYVQAAIGLRLMSMLEVSMFGRYDWIENVSGTVGLASYETDLEGGSFGGTLSLLF